MAFICSTWRDLVANPEADGERFGAEGFVALVQRLAPQHLHRADQCRGSLELLQCQQAKRVAHDHGQTARAVEPAEIALHAPDGHGERRHAQIGFCFAAAGGEPQQIGISLDGLDAIRTLVAQAPQHLRPGGWLLLEHGWDQADAVRALLAQAGGQQVGSRRDLAGIERCSGAQWP